MTRTKRKKKEMHGLTHSTEQSVWTSMIQRCANPSNPNFPRYGAIGITVCDRWRNSLAAFVEDMGRRPSIKHTLDRIKNSLGYFKENCRWATHKAQMRNTRRNRVFTHNGKTQCMQDWCNELGIKACTMIWRLNHGWAIEDALTIPGISPEHTRKGHKQLKLQPITK